VLAAVLAATAWLALAGAADGYFRHGWSASWFTSHEGQRVVVDTTTEHRVEMPNAHRPLARYVQGWPFERIPRPTALPTIDAELRARITIPSGPALVLGAESVGPAEIWVDGRPAAEGPISPGVHDVLVHWTARPGAHPRGGSAANTASFQLTWGPGELATTPVPREALVPGDGSWPQSRVILLWMALLGGLAWGAGAYFAFASSDERARRRRAGALVTVLVVLLGTGYRLFDYDVMPEFRENADELFATWNGWSLLEDGTTRGWSLWPEVYGGTVRHTQVRFFGEVRPVIEPYFEHPPLLHVLVGAAAHLGGAEHWLDAKLRHTRLVPIGLSALALFLMIAIGRRLYPRSPAAWLGALLFGVIPTIALQTRVIKEEALLVPLSLGMVWFFLKWRDDGRRMRHLLGAAICAGLAPLAKIPAVVWVPALVMLVAAERGETRRAVWAGIVGLAVASLLLVFAAVVDWDVFVLTQAQQGTRPTHWNLFPRFFDATLINHSLIGRGWALFLWVAFAASIFRRGRRDGAVLGVPLVTYLVAISVGSGNWTFGWYIVPLYPFLCLGAGDFLADLWKRPTLLGGALFVVLLVMYSLNFTLDPTWAKQPEAWPTIRRAVTLTVALSLAPYALVQVWRNNAFLGRLARLTTAVGLVAVVTLCGYFIATYDTAYETYRDFDRDTYFHR
jgi:4-amino-4-deoxy-L-arabinose transferase-like glycosyltransferase